MIKQLDLISESVNLNYKGGRSHSSFMGAGLTVIILLLSCAFSIYSLRELWEKKKPSSNVITKYTQNAGNYSIGPGGVPHYYMFKDANSGEIVKIDPRATEIKSMVKDRAGNVKGRYEFSHCNEVDKEYLGDFISDDNLEKAYCIRKFINVTTNEEVILTKSTKETFPWLDMLSGQEAKVTDELKTVYYTNVTECRNTTEKNDCYPQEVIDKYFIGKYYQFLFIDKVFDVTNNKAPIESSLNQVEGLFSVDTVVANHLNFNPSTIESDEGFILEELSSERAIYLDQNEKISAEKNGDALCTQVNFWLKNQETIYSRSYSKLQDILADIGGFFNFIYYSAMFLIHFPSKYITIYDTQNLLKFNNFVFTREEDLNKLVKQKISSNIKTENKTILNSEQNLKIMPEKENLEKNEEISNYFEDNYEKDNDDVVRPTITRFQYRNGLNSNLKSKSSNLNVSKNNSTIKLKKVEEISLKNSIVKKEVPQVSPFTFSYSHMLLFCFNQNKNPLYSKIEKIRDGLLSEENLFYSFFELLKSKKVAFGDIDSHFKNDTIIMDNEIINIKFLNK